MEVKIKNTKSISENPIPRISKILFRTLLLVILTFLFICIFWGFLKGLIIGGILVIIWIIGLIAVMVLHSSRSTQCAVCNRPTVNFGNGKPSRSEKKWLASDIDTKKRAEEGRGNQCDECGRIYCSNCEIPDLVCECGSKYFRTVRTLYY
jgi:hypothetical protein